MNVTQKHYIANISYMKNNIYYRDKYQILIKNLVGSTHILYVLKK